MQPPGFWITLFRIYRKDTLLEWKSPAGLISTLLFAMVLAVIYHYSIEDTVFRNRANLNGVMLATLFFASSISASRNAFAETEAGALRIHLMSRCDPSGYYLGKVAALWQLQILFVLLYVPLYFIFLTGRLFQTAQEFYVPVLVLSLAALSLSALGVVLSYIARGNRMKEVLFPLLLLPVSIPVFMAASLSMRSLQADFSAAFAPIIALLAPAGLYCGLGSLFYFILASDE